MMQGRSARSSTFGLADAGDQFRCAAQDGMERRQPLCNEGGVLQSRDADRKIEAFFHQIDKAIIQPHVENDLRMREAEIDQ